MKGILQPYFKVLSVFLGGSNMMIHPDTWFQKLLGPGTFWDAPCTRDASNRWEDCFFGGLDPVMMVSFSREPPKVA